MSLPGHHCCPCYVFVFARSSLLSLLRVYLCQVITVVPATCLSLPGHHCCPCYVFVFARSSLLSLLRVYLCQVITVVQAATCLSLPGHHCCPCYMFVFARSSLLSLLRVYLCQVITVVPATCLSLPGHHCCPCYVFVFARSSLLSLLRVYLCQVITVVPATCLSSGLGGTPTPSTARHLHSFVEPKQESCPAALDSHKHKCPDCEAVFSDKSQLQCHTRMKHPDKLFACPQCLRTFGRICSLNEHVKRIHEKLHRYLCEMCGRVFSARSHYDDHVAMHAGVNRNVCFVCLKEFTLKRNLKAHMLHFHPAEIAHE